MRPRTARFIFTASVLAITGLALTACSSSRDPRAGEFRSNPTPGVVTLSRTNDDMANRLTIMSDYNLSLMVEDFGRFWHADRPSRLTPRPNPY